MAHGLDRGSTISEPLACPIAMKVAMDRTRSCNHEHDRSEYFNSIATSFANEYFNSIAMRFANEYVARDDARQRGSDGEGRTKTFLPSR